MAKKLNNVTLFDNYNCDFEEYKQDYLENNDVDSVSDNVVWDYISMIEEEDYKSALHELDLVSNGSKWIVSGKVGTWRGNFEAYKIFNSAKEMVQAIAQNCDYIKIWLENNKLFVQASHHDGTNCFQCKLLTNKGLEMFDKWNCGVDCKVGQMCENELYDLLFINNFFSKNIKINWL